MEPKVKALIALGIIIRVVFWLTTPVTGDATFHLSVIRYIAENGSIPVFEEEAGPNPFWYPPLFHLTSAFFHAVLRDGRLATLFFGCAGIFAFNRLVSRHYPKQEAKSTAVLCLMPFHIYYSSIAYPESLLFLVSVMAYDSYLSYLRCKLSTGFIHALMFSVLAATTHYHGWAVLASIAAHMLMRERKKAIAFLFVGLVLASPWYIRNYSMFGNPIWPKLGAGHFVGDTAVQKLPLSDAVTNLFNPKRWVGTYYDFLIGAPNSGEDAIEKMTDYSRGNPYALVAAIMWFFAAFAILYFTFAGLMAQDMRTLAIAALAVAFCTLPYAGNGLARIFTPAIVFFPIILSKGCDSSRRGVILWISLSMLVAGSYAYSHTYMSMRQGYAGFFQMMREGIDANERVLMPYNIGECLYFSERKCVRVGSAEGIPETGIEDLEETLEEYGVKYVCCTSINEQALKGYNKMVCDHYAERPALFRAVDGNIWGRCWRAY